MATIDEYSFGRIVIDGKEHDRDVIILPNRLVTNWWRKEGHGLVLEDLDEVIDDIPGHLVVGNGAHGQMKPDPKTIERLRSRGIEVEVLQTEEAVGRYSELDPGKTAAALHLTC
jgi:hypothetical protein